MRYSKFKGHQEPRLPRGGHGKWYDLHEFLELKDLEEGERRGHAPRPPRPRPIDPLASSSDYIPHTLGHRVDEEDDTTPEPDIPVREEDEKTEET